MQSAPLPPDETDRLASLYRQNLLDTAPDPDLDRITELVAMILGTPIALISLVDNDRQWFKSRVGIDVPETPRSVSFCAHAIAGRAPLIVEDTLLDARFVDNPLVTEPPSIRAYAGVPLETTEGFAIGTLCAIDRKPRKFTEHELALLRGLGQCVQDFLHLRYRLVDVGSEQEALMRLIAMSMHDLRNPLTSLLSGVHLLGMGQARTAADAEVLEDMLVAVDEMQRVLLDTLDVALSEARELTVHRREVQIGALVTNVARALGPTIKVRRQVLETVLPPQIGAAIIDATMIRRALGNLVVNSIKHSPDGSRIKLSVVEARTMLRFEVSDEGEGIPDEHREMVFEVFRTGSTARAGYGLGLAFCRLAAGAHGGTVFLADKPPGEPGALFVLEVPRAPPT